MLMPSLDQELFGAVDATDTKRVKRRAERVSNLDAWGEEGPQSPPMRAV